MNPSLNLLLATCLIFGARVSEQSRARQLTGSHLVKHDPVTADPHHADHGSSSSHDEHGHGDHGHDEHGHDDHGHEEHGHDHGHVLHGHHKPDPVATLVAMLLLGMVAWVMSLFYFVNYHDPDVRQTTWDMLSAMITIFCGVLIFSGVKMQFVTFAGEDPGHHHGAPDVKSLLFAGVRFLLLFLMLEVSFVSNIHKPWYMVVFASVASHVVGFSAIEVFGGIMHQCSFGEGVLGSLISLFACLLIMTLLWHAVSILRQKIVGGDHERWNESSYDFEAEAAGLAQGLLISMVVRQSISGILPPIHGQPRFKSQTECVALLVASLMFVPLVLVSHIAKQKTDKDNTLMVHFVHSLHHTIKMTMGWCLLFWGQWQFYTFMDNHDTIGGKMTTQVLLALIFSALVFAAIILVDFFADKSSEQFEKALRAVVLAFALLMGLAWEAAFTQAMSGVGNQFMGTTATLVTTGLSMCLCFLVLPAWAWYILPCTTEGKHITHHETTDDKDFDGVAQGHQ